MVYFLNLKVAFLYPGPCLPLIFWLIGLAGHRTCYQGTHAIPCVYSAFQLPCFAYFRIQLSFFISFPVFPINFL